MSFEVLSQVKGADFATKVGEIMDHFAMDEDFVDNHRVALSDDPDMMWDYEQAKMEGCCGSFDHEVVVDGCKVWIGFNYGH